MARRIGDQLAMPAVRAGGRFYRTDHENGSPADRAEGCMALMRQDAASATFRHAIDMRQPTTAATTASNPSYRSAGWRCCRCGAAEADAGDTWRIICSERDRMHLVTLATTEGPFGTQLTLRQRQIRGALDLPEPPRLYDRHRGPRIAALRRHTRRTRRNRRKGPRPTACPASARSSTSAPDDAGGWRIAGRCGGSFRLVVTASPMDCRRALEPDSTLPAAMPLAGYPETTGACCELSPRIR